MKINLNLRNLKPMQQAVCNVNHVAIVPEVQKALLAWVRHKADTSKGVLIGGLAMSFYSKPRYTQDVDFLFLMDTDIPAEVEGFKHHRTGAFEDRKTGVEVEVCTPRSINLPRNIAERVFETAVNYDGVRVASIEGLIALKLIGSEVAKRHHRDLGDIQTILESNRGKDLTLRSWPLSEAQRTQLDKLLKADTEDQ